MSDIKAIKAVMVLENCQGIFRRDLFNRKYMNYIVSSLRPLTVLILIFQDSTLNLSAECLEIQNFMVNFRTISIILCSTYTSNKFIEMNKHINNFQEVIDRKEAYLNMTKILNVVVFSTVLFLLMFGVAIEYYFWLIMPDRMIECHRKVLIMLFYIELFLADFLPFTEALLYYCLCSVISYQLESLSELIRTDMQSLQNNITDKFKLPKQCWKRWGDSYMNIGDCVQLLNSVFGLQITMTLFVTGLHFVYLFQYFITRKNFQTLVLLAVPQLMIIAFISKAGQVIKNNAVNFRRALVKTKLIIAEDENEESFNAISSVISLTSGRPIHTQIFGSIATGYAMLPAVFMYFTTPLIIVLQFKV